MKGVVSPALKRLTAAVEEEIGKASEVTIIRSTEKLVRTIVPVSASTQ